MNIMDTHGHFVSPEPNSGCWLWIGETANAWGYGRVKVKNKAWVAHRYSWYLKNGPIPPRVKILPTLVQYARVSGGVIYER